MKTVYSRFGPELGSYLQDLADELGLSDDKEHAFHMLTTFLRVLRKRMSLEGSFFLIDLLPLPMKAVYADEWHINHLFEPMVNLEDFEADMLAEYGSAAARDFVPRNRIIIAVKDLLRVTAQKMDEVEKAEMLGILPDAIRPLWEETLAVEE